MLRIKEGIDLKELEKYGFTYREHYENYTKGHHEKDYEDYVDNYIQIGNDRILQPYARLLKGHDTEYIDNTQANIKDEFLDTLYDLIKADMVERI